VKELIMSETIQVKVLARGCAAGDAYAEPHLTGKPKVVIGSCEGACVKGEIARRAANLVAHRLAPDRAVRICHGGAFLLDRGGMRRLVERAERVLILEGCPMACGTRLARAAFPGRAVEPVMAMAMYDGDSDPFSTSQIADADLTAKATQVAEAVAREYFGGPGSPESVVQRPGLQPERHVLAPCGG
jgi:uncharacterized metal-binding protein